MQFRYAILFAVLSIIFSSSPDVKAYSLNELRGENQLLKAELKLAKKTNNYFIFDLKEKKVYFKNHGILLKDLEIERVRLWGQPPDLKPHTMIKKSTLFKPKRKKIKPEEDTEKTKTVETTDKFEIEALELKDMPTGFKMVFDNGIIISVRQKPEGFFSGFKNIYYTLTWYVTHPLLTIWNSLQKNPFTSIYITMSKKDVQSLYWSFYEGLESIIYYPRD